jgi:hypothetical protein
MGRWLAAFFLSGAFAMPFAKDARAQPGDSQQNEVPLDVREWQIVKRESGPTNYYWIVDDPVLPYIHSEYRPPLETVVLGAEVKDADRSLARKLRWKWRALVLPREGNECAYGKADSAAVVYVSWKRGLRWYALKYVWSSVGAKGQTCERKRNPFVAQDTVILESGSPLGAWKDEEIDLFAEFRAHFADGDSAASVPAFVGVGVMSDGDQTQSDSSADFAAFRIVR